MKEARRLVFNFLDGGIPADSGSADSGPFSKTISGTGGTITKTSEGLLLASSGGASVTCISMNDQLVYDIDDLIAVEFLVKLVTSQIANSRVMVGLGTARNNSADAITQHVHFSAEGSTALTVESDDNGTNDNDGLVTGLTWTGGWQRLVIDFAEGVKTQSPPFQSVGGKGDVRFKASNAGGALRPINLTTGVDMSAYTGGLQPLLQINNGGSSDVVSLAIREIVVEHKINP